MSPPAPNSAAACVTASHNSGPFDAAPTSALRTRTGVSADARFDTPMGPGRLYIQVGHDNFQP